MPVHFLDDDNKWTDYDNSLVSTESKNATEDEALIKGYGNKKSNIDIRYSGVSTDDYIMCKTMVQW